MCLKCLMLDDGGADMCSLWVCETQGLIRIERQGGGMLHYFMQKLNQH
jgi:hypothetical protein